MVQWVIYLLLALIASASVDKHEWGTAVLFALLAIGVAHTKFKEE